MFVLFADAYSVLPIFPYGPYRAAGNGESSRGQRRQACATQQQGSDGGQQSPRHVQLHAPVEGLRIDDEHQDQADAPPEDKSHGNADRGQ